VGCKGSETKGLQYQPEGGWGLKYNGPRNKEMKHLCKSLEHNVCSRWHSTLERTYYNVSGFALPKSSY
jgi:hypothetical protein